jgi:hypothetical protein
MTQPPNPITQGLRAIRRDPAVFLLEILWRWSFAAVAVLIVFFAGTILLDKRHVDAVTQGLQTKDARLIGIALLSGALLLGMKAIVAMIVVPLVIALVWTFFVSPARRITARRLRAAAPLRFGAMLMLQFVRAFSTWIAYVLLIGGVALAIYFATSGPRYDPVIFYAVGSPIVVLIALLWLVLNWYLSVAAIFGREGQSFPGAFRQARSIVRAQRSDFAGTGFIFLLLRLVLLALVIAICGLTSSMQASAPENYALLVIIVALIYFAISDVLYVWRMATYVALAAAFEEDVIAQLERSAPPAATTGKPK